METSGEILMWAYWAVVMLTATALVFWFALKLQDRVLNRRDAQHLAALKEAREADVHVKDSGAGQPAATHPPAVGDHRDPGSEQ